MIRDVNNEGVIQNVPKNERSLNNSYLKILRGNVRQDAMDSNAFDADLESRMFWNYIVIFTSGPTDQNVMLS